MDVKASELSMALNGEFACTGNLFLADLMTNPTKKTPIYRKVIRSLQDQFLSEPTSRG